MEVIKMLVVGIHVSQMLAIAGKGSLLFARLTLQVSLVEENPNRQCKMAARD